MFTSSWYDLGEAFTKMTESASESATKYYKDMTEKPDKYKSLIEMVSDYDYPIEQHFYETQDGYINRVHRIAGPRGSKVSQ